METINEWLEEIDCEGQLELMSSQESHIKYYRLKSSMHSGVIIDFSQYEEAFQAFLKLNLPLYEAGVTVPKIFTYNREEFLVFMEDLGSTHLCDVESSDMELFYDKAIDAIIKMQNTELDHMKNMNKEYLLSQITFEKAEVQLIIEQIVDEILQQPQDVFVHAQYQAKNLMFNCNNSIVVTEYYNAKLGAVTYDLATLLSDSSIYIERSDKERLALSFKEKKGLSVNDETFIRWFDFSSLYQQIKHLSQKEKVSIEEIKKIASKYEETSPLVNLLD